MKRIYLALVIALIATSMFAQNEKNLVYDPNATVRKVESFKKIEVSNSIDLYLSQGTEEAVAVSAASPELVEKIKTEVTDGVLHIYFNERGFNWRSWTNTKMKAYITFKDLSGIKAGGASNVRVTQPMKVDDLDIEVSGASNFSGNITASNIKLDASGASGIKISGRANETTISASGASSIKGYDLSTNYCKIDASGASGVRITVMKELSADASGASSINYKGEGVIKSVDTSGGSSIKKRADSE